MRKWTLYMLLIPVLLAQALCSCSLIDEDPSGTDGVSLAFDVSVKRIVTRMSDNMTQQPGTSFRGIQDLCLFPFDVEGVIDSDATSLSGSICNPHPVSGTYHYLDNHAVDLSINTASFLCYARAQGSGGQFINGSTVATIPNGKISPSTISFAPEVIYNSIEIEDGDKASKIAAYLTAVANYLKNTGNNDLYLQFINSGHPVACSSTNIAKLKNWIETAPNNIDLSSITSTYDADYPEDINLPDGAAVVKWNTSTNAFEPQLVTTTEANVNRLDRFIYPAELWYYVNSRIKTSIFSQEEHYSLTDWSKVLDKYENDNGIMNASIHSVAIKDPLSYAVGCLQVGLVANNILTDANEDNPNTITLSSSTFPLTAIFVSGQHAQAFNFTPKDDNTEYIIYDKVITGISMGDARTATPSTATPSKYTNTLVLQSQDGKSVRFALEFENNSGKNFWGINGIVFAGTKFYLVGTIKVPTGQTEDYKKRAFTKAYTTQGTVTISSLKQAYTYLPDLLDPRLEIGIELVPSWIQSTTTNVPL